MMYGKFLTILVACVLICAEANAQSKRKKRKADIATEQWRYEVECASEARQGTYYVTIWMFIRSPQVALSQGRKNAVHAILFKGYPDTHFESSPTCKGQKPLISDISVFEEKKEFFDEFFREDKKDGYNYMRFVQGTGDVTRSIRIRGKGYKVGVQVVINKEGLRKYLEKSKIIRKLGIN